ncbi:DUF2059 domain-containing protein [Massilia forsythiae]|uniref:DUF2059 domain-containing protein n=1 Tax=Massilia forsythiae TaxID=2728020 RepID=A0A7Z2VTC7_9BURK|nr:DUF2059 domain-containing protein [Massilia forsythiae]QJD98843.1 DUF2059 domain-containing protein [Massilia forsythiae]
MKKQLAAVAVIFAMSSTPSFAQSAPVANPAVEQATRQMFDAMKIRDTMILAMKQAVAAMPAQMRGGIAGAIQADANMSAAQKKEATERLDKELPAMTVRLQAIFNDPGLVDDMLKEMVPLYAQTYTVDEIHQLTAFYTSPLGQKMMANMPKLMAQSMEMSSRVMMPRIQKLMAQTTRNFVGKQ